MISMARNPSQRADTGEPPLGGGEPIPPLNEETSNAMPWWPNQKLVEDGPGATKAASEMAQNYTTDFENPYLPPSQALPGHPLPEPEGTVHISDVDHEENISLAIRPETIRDNVRPSSKEAEQEMIKDALKR